MIEDGDIIEIDAEKRTMNALDIDDAEWEARKKKWTDTRPVTAAPSLPYEPPVLDAVEPEEDIAYDFFAAPTRRPPALAEFTLPRDRVRPRERPVTASEIIRHRRATNDFKDDLRAVRALNKFKVPKSRTSIVAI